MKKTSFEIWEDELDRKLLKLASRLHTHNIRYFLTVDPLEFAIACELNPFNREIKEKYGL